ncbi:hypothetical protein O181_048090 [Austropuccinia psidii MF-1]|uniref:Uncharacterized protein n=1 Tax=Austropuccinia psidii MF-1 TaxID=1389203 RepID=A0A9Q3HNV4_9BASI|nr:hypothetical protein [Austropuccinia psidii MF-1]
MLQVSGKSQKGFVRLQEHNSRLQDIIALKAQNIHTLKEEYIKLAKASKETNRRLNQDKPSEKVEEVLKKKNASHNHGATDHYANNCPKAKEKIDAILQVAEEEVQEKDFESDSRGDAIRENSDYDQDLIEEFLVEYQEENQLGIHDIHLEAKLP